MWRKLSIMLVLAVVLGLSLDPFAATMSSADISLPGGGVSAAGESGGKLELVDCPEDIDSSLASTTTLQVIDDTFHKWHQYETEKEFFIFLEEPDSRPLTAAEARELLDASGEWSYDHLQANESREQPASVDEMLRAIVFGRDERERVTSGASRSYPWNNVGLVINSFPDGSMGRASAFLVNHNVALTNAHVIYQAEHGGWFDELRFVPGLTQDSRGGELYIPYGYREPVDASIPRGYAGAHPELDYGALFFEGRVSGISTFMPVQFNAEPDYVNLVGYPGRVRGETDSWAMWHSFGPVSQIYSDMFTFHIDISQGNSGGPIFTYNPQTDVSRVVGVVAGSYGTTHHGFNVGPRFANHNRALIETWMKWKPGAEQVSHYTLEVDRQGQGSTTPARGEHVYQEGSRVNLVAEPASGWEFDKWVIDGRQVKQSQTTITMNSNRQATAHFSQTPVEYNLSVNVRGEGTVSPVPGVHAYPAGTRVTLEARPASGWEFEKWVVNGREVPSSRTTVTMDSDQQAAAHFTQVPEVKEVTFHVGSDQYWVGDNARSLDVPPFIEDGRTFLPVRVLAEEMGLEADWGPKDSRTEWVALTKPGLRIDITIDKSSITVVENGHERTVYSDVAAHIRNGRTALPMRAVGEILGAEFDWGPKDSSLEWVRFSL